MGRALSFSLVAHATFILLFLLLSATRQPLTLPQVSRPVRLVTYIEPAGAPRQRPATVASPAPLRPAPPPPAAGTMPEPVPAAPHPSSPTAIQRVAVPVPAPSSAPARPAAATPDALEESRPALAERLARRLAAASPTGSRPAQVAAPQIASLPRPDAGTVTPLEPAGTPVPAVAAPGAAAAPPGAVGAVGYFPHAWYLAGLQNQVLDRWRPPSEFFKSRQPPVAVVSFRISRSGRIEAVALKEKSGSARFDQSALATVQGLGRVSPLPEQYREETLDVYIRFQNEK